MSFEVEGQPAVAQEQFTLREWTFRQFQRIIERLNTGQEFLQLTETNVEPERPREGMVRFADGTNWDPGSGRGFYGYGGTSWSKL